MRRGGPAATFFGGERGWGNRGGRRRLRRRPCQATGTRESCGGWLGQAGRARLGGRREGTARPRGRRAGGQREAWGEREGPRRRREGVAPPMGPAPLSLFLSLSPRARPARGTVLWTQLTAGRGQRGARRRRGRTSGRRPLWCWFVELLGAGGLVFRCGCLGLAPVRAQARARGGEEASKRESKRRRHHEGLAAACSALHSGKTFQAAGARLCQPAHWSHHTHKTSSCSPR